METIATVITTDGFMYGTMFGVFGMVSSASNATISRQTG